MTPDVNVVISHSEYTVLVVDDVVSNVLLLKVLLTNEKFKVITAGNGKEALSQAVNARPDLILLDVMMPEMNGFEVAERLKADPETQHIPIIFLTALNTTASISFAICQITRHPVCDEHKFFDIAHGVANANFCISLFKKCNIISMFISI